MNFEVTLEAVFCGDDCTDEQVTETLGAVMEALVDLGVTDPAVGGALATRKFEIALVVEADSEQEAFGRGTRLIAKALEELGLKLQAQPGLVVGSDTDDVPTLEWSSTSVRPAAVA